MRWTSLIQMKTATSRYTKRAIDDSIGVGVFFTWTDYIYSCDGFIAALFHFSLHHKRIPARWGDYVSWDPLRRFRHRHIAETREDPLGDNGTFIEMNLLFIIVYHTPTKRLCMPSYKLHAMRFGN